MIDFENEGRVEHNRMGTHDVWMNRRLRVKNPLYDNNIFGLDVCLPRDEIEEIVKGRPGGKEMLLSDARFMTLLGRGLRRVIVTDDDEELFVVKFDDSQLEEIRQCIKKSSLIVAKLRQNEVVEAITRSFAGDERDTELPPKEQCYLAESSFNALKFLGLPIQESDFVNENGWGSGNKDDFQFRWRFS